MDSEHKELKTILLADDIPANLELLCSYLAGKYKTAIAKNGETAILRAEMLNPSLILLDIQMPGIDGYETCRRLKQNPKTRDIPVIFMTALTESTNKLKGFETGGVDYITKPVDCAELLARIDTHVSLAVMRDELRMKNEELVQKNHELEINIGRQKRVEQILRHDLKSPLQVMYSLPDLILSDENLTEEQTELIECVHEASKRMLEIIDSSLTLYKMEHGAYTPNLVPIDLRQVLKSVADSVRSLIEKKGITLLVNDADLSSFESFVIPGEDVPLFMLFSNIIKNALEASPFNETVYVTLLPAEQMVTITVRNRGAVPPEIRETFFEELTTSGKEHGTGIGTYSARLVCEALGGSIELDCSAEDETTILITLPR